MSNWQNLIWECGPTSAAAEGNLGRFFLARRFARRFFPFAFFSTLRALPSFAETFGDRSWNLLYEGSRVAQRRSVATDLSTTNTTEN